ncbi:MAG: TVP38/TMEM64 family protein [Deltaproteobacteria bacterium]|nr:TVP38/TMEM64 family protein [Deltaproteobacteria bacterium]
MNEAPNNRKKQVAAVPPPASWRQGMASIRRNWLIWSIAGLVLLTLLSYAARCAVCSTGLWDWACRFYFLMDDKEKVTAFLKKAGPAAPLTFMVTQVLQVVFAPIPGEATGFIGGYLFGVPLGMLYSTIGLTVGSMSAFLLGRLLEVKFVARVVSRGTLDKFDFLMERQGALIAFFLFVVPGFPKDYLCFILGLSTMDWRLFFLMSTVGRLPGTLMLTLQGAHVYRGNYLVSALLLGFCLALAGGLFLFREPLYQWLLTWHKNHLNKRS